MKETVDLAERDGRGLTALSLAADEVRQRLNANRFRAKLPVLARTGVEAQLDDAADQAHARARESGEGFAVELAWTLRALEWLLVRRDQDQIKAFSDAAREYFDRNPDLPRPFAASKGSGDEQLLALLEKCHRDAIGNERIARIVLGVYPKLRPRTVVDSGGRVRHKDCEVTEADLVKALEKAGRREDAEDDDERALAACRAIVRVVEGPRAGKDFLDAERKRQRRADRKVGRKG